MEEKLQNMKNIREALKIEAANEQGNIIKHAISGLKAKREYLNTLKTLKTEEERSKFINQQDDIARAELQAVGAETYNPKRPIKLTYNQNKKSKNNGGKKQRTNKNKKNKNKKSRRI